MAYWSSHDDLVAGLDAGSIVQVTYCDRISCELASPHDIEYAAALTKKDR